MKRPWCAAAFVAALMPAVALAQLQQTPGSNVQVTQCLPHMHQAGTSHPWIDPYGNWHTTGAFPVNEGFLAISFTNAAKVPISEIDFGLVARSSLVATAKDVGTFSPGAPISHEYVISPEVFPIGTAFPQCVVLLVKYADGTDWHNPSPPPM